MNTKHLLAAALLAATALVTPTTSADAGSGFPTIYDCTAVVTAPDGSEIATLTRSFRRDRTGTYQLGPFAFDVTCTTR